VAVVQAAPQIPITAQTNYQLSTLRHQQKPFSGTAVLLQNKGSLNILYSEKGQFRVSHF
jgi:hypothetical protein